MTSWPWMKGVNVALADPPIAPVCKEDKRPAVNDLIREYRDGIDQIRHELVLSSPALYDPNKHDDLWILRFLLSHKHKPRAALKAAKRTLEFRKEHRLDERGDIRAYPPGQGALCDSFQRYFECCTDDAIQFEIPDPQRGVITFLKGTGFDLFQLLKHVDYEDRVKTFCYVNEWTHQWLDYITRTTGRFTKAIRLVDTKGFGLSQLSYEGLRLDGKAMCSMEDYYPQLLDSFFICDPPCWAHYPWSVLRPLMPKRIVHKIDFIAPGKNKKERKRLEAYVKEEHLPQQYRGRKINLDDDNVSVITRRINLDYDSFSAIASTSTTSSSSSSSTGSSANTFNSETDILQEPCNCRVVRLFSGSSARLE